MPVQAVILVRQDLDAVELAPIFIKNDFGLLLQFSGCKRGAGAFEKVVTGFQNLDFHRLFDQPVSHANDAGVFLKTGGSIVNCDVVTLVEQPDGQNNSA